MPNELLTILIAGLHFRYILERFCRSLVAAAKSEATKRKQQGFLTEALPYLGARTSTVFIALNGNSLADLEGE